jgi:hypothetical protein
MGEPKVLRMECSCLFLVGVTLVQNQAPRFEPED